MNEEIQKLRELLKAATPGPWEYAQQHGQDCVWHDVLDAGEEEIFSAETGSILDLGSAHELRKQADLELCAALRNSAESLLSAAEERDTLKAKLETIKEKVLAECALIREKLADVEQANRFANDLLAQREAQVAEKDAEIAQLREDKERLDWWITHCASDLCWDGGRWAVYHGGFKKAEWCDTPREAIDAARAALKAEAPRG